MQRLVVFGEETVLPNFEDNFGKRLRALVANSFAVHPPVHVAFADYPITLLPGSCFQWAELAQTAGADYTFVDILLMNLSILHQQAPIATIA